jgi:hypothetical protein
MAVKRRYKAFRMTKMKQRNLTCSGLLLLVTIMGALGADVPGASRSSAAPQQLLLVLHGRDVSARLKAAHSLGDSLKSGEIDELCRFIKARPGADEKNLPALQLLKNDLISALMEQKSPPAQLGDTLIQIYEDQGQDAVMRDYAIQHLAVWLGRGVIGDTGGERVRAVLWQAAREDDAIAGTALLGIHRLAAIEAGFERREIKERAVTMAGSARCSLAARITALQVCAEENAVEALPMIRTLTQAKLPMALRISAVAALGQLGGEQDITLLTQMKADHDAALQTAVTAALRRLRQEIRLQKVA